MKKHIYSFWVLLFLCNSLFSQDNLSISLDTVPGFLNVCGDTDDERVTISVNGASVDTRTNIVATAMLFKGVEFESLDVVNSSVGVTLLSAGDPNQPVFSIPDLSPSGTSSVVVAFNVRANCEYIDTLRGGTGIFDVLDTWVFDYDMGLTTGLTESDATIEYRDALAFPIFVSQMDNSFGPARLGDCFTRTLTINNTGVAGFVDSLFYENVQGAGVSVQSVSINGIPASITKTFVGGDTIISAGIGINEITANLGGDADAFFDPGESMEIVENICLMDCDGDRTSLHNISWGCYGRFCETISENDFVTVGLGAADILVDQLDFVTDVDAGYCQQGVTTLTFTNVGIEDDPGFATMLDVAAGINFRYDINSGTGHLTDGAYEITAVEIGSVTIATISDLISLDGNPQFFGVDPDGPGGLSDFDSDGYFDDLATGEFVKVRAHYDFNCSMGQGTGSNCANEFATSFNGIMEYNDLCGDALVRRNLGYKSVTNIKVDEEITVDTDADLQKDTFYIVYRQNRQVSNFSKTCSNGEEYHVAVQLPTGVSMVAGVTELRLSGNNVAALKSSTQSNDTLYLVFDASLNPLGIPLIHELTLGLQAACGTTTGETNFPLEFAHYCPDCDCKHIWFCDIIPGPWLHTTDPPCAPPACPYGLGTRTFNVERTTIGYTDNQYTTKLADNLVNKKAGLPCDSVEMSILTVVGDASLTDSIGMVITYNNPDGTLNTEETFLFAGGDLVVRRGGTTVLTCPVTPAAMTLTLVDSTKIMDFDLNDCLISNGFTLLSGDTVEFIGGFTINPVGAFPTNEFTEVPNMRGYGYAVDADSTFICDSFGEEFMIGGLETYVAFPNSATTIQGCGEITLNIKINPSLNEYVTNMGQEHRKALQVDSVVINFDTNIFDAFDRFSSTVTFRGHPTEGNNPINLPAFTDFTSGRYVVYFDTLNWGPSLIDALIADGFDMAITVMPNCQTSFSGALGAGDSYVFNPELYFVKNAYALEYGDGSCAEVFNDANTGTLLYLNPPRIALNPVTNPNYTLAADTAEWVIQYCNPDFDRDIGFTWVAVEDSLGAIEVISIEDISDATDIDTLNFRTYGTNNENFVAYSDGLLRADGTNSLDEICNTIRIKARVNRCGTTGFTASTGWNCLAPSDPLWTPADYDPCTENVLDLTVTTLDPFIDADLIGPPTNPLTLCDTNTVEILVKNTQRGNAFDITTDLLLPLQGTTLVPGSVEIAYPANAPYVSAFADPVFAGTSNKGNIYRYDDFSQLNLFLDQTGLPGFDAAIDVDSSRFKIRYQFVTDCDFRSGSIAFYSFEGLKGCGDPSNVESGETLPLNIDGVPPAGANSFDIFFEVSTNLIPGEISTVEIVVVNKSAVPSDASDKVNLQLPLEIEYIDGTSVSTTPIGWIPGDPLKDTVNTIQDLLWDLPIGMQQNDTARFSFMVNTPLYDCSISSLEVGLFTLVQTDITCSTSGMDCTIESVTSNNGGALTDLPIRQNILLLNNALFTSACRSSTQETVTFTANLFNMGDTIGALPINIRYFIDVDENGSYDGTEPEYISFVENGPINPGEILNFSHSFPLGLDDLCNLLVYVDSTGLGLCQPSEMAPGGPQLINAGLDELHCTTTPITINSTLGDTDCVGLTGYVYNWTALAPASTADLSATNIANPVLNVNHAGITEDTLHYILETTRPACGGLYTTTDTVNIIRGLGFGLTPLSPVFVSAGDSVLLDVAIVGGTAPFTYTWSPSTTLTDSTLANPQAFPMVNTEYFVTITSATGCSEISSVEVQLNNPVNGTVNVSDTTICPGDTLQLIASGGTDYLWEANPANPAGGMLSATNIANPTFTSAMPVAVYLYQVLISDVAFPGITDTLDVTIRTNGPQVVSPVADFDNCNGDTTRVTVQINELIDNYTITGSGGVANEIVMGNLLSFDAIYTGGISTFDVNLLGSSSACSVTESFVINPCACVAPTLNSVIVTEATCTPPVGGLVTINLHQDESNYNFTWTPDVGQSPGGNVNMRSGLTAGVYQVLIAQNNTLNCSMVLDVIVSNTDGPDATHTTLPATCALNDGAATFSVDTLNYEWPDGFMGDTRNDLTAGNYPVTITNPTAPDCPNYTMVTIESENPLTAAVVINSHPDCNSATGSATINVSGGSGNYTYSWLSDTNTQGNLAAGLYTVTVNDTDPTACDLEVFFALPANTGATVALTAINPVSCNGSADGGITFNLNFDPLAFQPADTLIVNGTDTLENGQLPGGNYCVLVVDNTGCIGASACFEIVEPDAMDLLFVITPACPDDGAIDLTVHGGMAPFNYDWADVSGTNNSEDRTGLDLGVYPITVTDDNGCIISEDAVVVPACNNSCDYFFGQDTVNLVATACDDLTLVCADMPTNLADQFVVFDNGVLFTGQLEGCIFDVQYSYNYGGVLINPPFDIEWTINGTMYSAAVLSIEALVDSMNVWDPLGNWQHISLATTILGGDAANTYSELTVTDALVGVPTPINFTPSQSPLSMGILVDTGFHEIIVTDTTTMCSDTLIAYVTCPSDDGYRYQTDTLCIGESFDFYIDTTRLRLAGDIVSVTPICEDANGHSVDFDLELQSMILTYTGATVGIDTACYEFRDDLGGIDTISFYVESINCSAGVWICDSVYIFQTKEFCPDTTILDGAVTRFENICADQSGPEVDFFLNPDTKCIEYTGVELGQDTACVIICDTFGLCDTTYFCISVLPYFDPPIANDDFDTTTIGTPVVIDIKANDILFGGVDTAYILTPPLYGTIGTGGNLNQLNLDCSATYNAGDEFCEREDQFSYVVCTPNGCDTATVYVWLECADIVIFTAVSPNSDQVNDFFHIAGILDFPDSKLMIYNRWGNLVYETIGYQNNWSGEWKNNKEVPDGTYYYILELMDDENRVFNGYLELYR